MPQRQRRKPGLVVFSPPYPWSAPPHPGGNDEGLGEFFVGFMRHVAMGIFFVNYLRISTCWVGLFFGNSGKLRSVQISY